MENNEANSNENLNSLGFFVMPLENSRGINNNLKHYNS